MSTLDDKKTDADKAKPGPQRELVDKLLARAPLTGSGRVDLDGGPLHYDIHAGFVPVRCEKHGDQLHEPEMAVFTTAYIARDVAGPRPVCFAFNGGPGASSVFLHLGALGPKCVPMPETGFMPPPPYEMVDNPSTWLKHFDLVFVDPPHTGYSVAVSDDVRKRAFSVDGDIAAMSTVVAEWLSRHQRWGSPLYLCGESYGTTRTAGIALKLLDEGVILAGVILVSCAMDLQALDFEPRNDLPYTLFLPAFAGVAHFHGCLKSGLADTPQAARDLAQDFVETEYLRALHRGALVGEKERSHAARRIAELTGLPRTLVEQRHLRIDDVTIFTELLRGRNQLLGRLDARVTGPLSLRQNFEWQFDPAIDALIGPYTAAARCFYGELGVSGNETYVIHSSPVHQAWDWRRGDDRHRRTGHACTSTDLADVMRRTPHLKVLVASGHYDLGTPSTATDWSLAQLELPSAARQRITHRYYDAGHMMYTRQTDLVGMERDLAAWLAAPAEAIPSEASPGG